MAEVSGLDGHDGGLLNIHTYCCTDNRSKQYAEASPQDTTRIVDSLHKFLPLLHELWLTGEYGRPELSMEFGYQYVRWEEVRFLQTGLPPTHAVYVARPESSMGLR